VPYSELNHVSLLLLPLLLEPASTLLDHASGNNSLRIINLDRGACIQLQLTTASRLLGLLIANAIWAVLVLQG
jgi:hypothetical protein